MHIWLITIGEPVPTCDRATDRLCRTGYFANFLANHGHQVVWWSSAFDHFRKAHVFSRDTTIAINSRLKIRVLHGGGYSSNLSPMRLLDHYRIAAKFRLMAPRMPIPDVVLCSLPTIDLSLNAVSYGREFDVPVVLDMRDMWPDIFTNVVPKPLRPITRFLMRHLERDARLACTGATAITGITEAFVEWGIKKAGRKRNTKDRAFPMGYNSIPFSREKLLKAESYWDRRGIDSKSFIVCFFGTLGWQLDIDTVIRAANNIRKSGRSISFLICGAGDRLRHFQSIAANNPLVVFPGWVDAAQIYVLLRRSAVGLDPLPDRYDFLATINNKAIEYLSAGVPVISSPGHGVLYDLLTKHKCGMSYPTGDVDALTCTLLDLYEDRHRLQKMSENASRLFKEMFTAEKVYGEMMEYLLEIAVLHKAGKKKFR